MKIGMPIIFEVPAFADKELFDYDFSFEEVVCVFLQRNRIVIRMRICVVSDIQAAIDPPLY
jgi:hypothetical protein